MRSVTDPILAKALDAPRGVKAFALDAPYAPTGDQPEAIDALLRGLSRNERNQVLLGVTGSGKTFTMANVIARSGRPALVLTHNKTLAAQLYTEFKTFFPNNAVAYFVSYYDYYQPESYVPQRDLYIEKESTRNERIDRLRHYATRALLERSDVIIVASVSAIFGIGSVEIYSSMVADFSRGQRISPRDVANQLIALQYTRNDLDFTRGRFRMRGDVIDVFPAHLDECALRLSFFGNELETITAFDPLTGNKIDSKESVYDPETETWLDPDERIRIYANSHYLAPRPTLLRAMEGIRAELNTHEQHLLAEGKNLERERLMQRTNYDLESLESTGMCPGIENYSRYLTGRAPGSPPPTLFEYLPSNTLLFVDESHVAVPQIGAMYRGDYNRKSTLAEYGFRLPSCVDNRPLTFQEWDQMRPQTIFVSATPGKWELEQTAGAVIEQIIRPTGLIDPICTVKPVATQIDDLMHRCRQAARAGLRVLVTTLTKRMAEDLTEYLSESGIRVRYLHSDIDTLERVELIRDLRAGLYDVLVGINLLREGLDIPECGLVAILDADKEGFLRSKTSLVQTIGRAARNINGEVVLYADKITDSLQYALDETDRRRDIQRQYNSAHQITPQSIARDLSAAIDSLFVQSDTDARTAANLKGVTAKFAGKSVHSVLKQLDQVMRHAASELDFERAAQCRDFGKVLEVKDLEAPFTGCGLSASDLTSIAEVLSDARLHRHPSTTAPARKRARNRHLKGRA